MRSFEEECRARGIYSDEEEDEEDAEDPRRGASSFSSSSTTTSSSAARRGTAARGAKRPARRAPQRTARQASSLDDIDEGHYDVADERGNEEQRGLDDPDDGVDGGHRGRSSNAGARKVSGARKAAYDDVDLDGSVDDDGEDAGEEEEEEEGNGDGARDEAAEEDEEDEEVDYYRVLEVDRRASMEEITRSYRRLAMRLHPDRQAGLGEAAARAAQRQFHEVQTAYDVLRYEESRRVYDSVGVAGVRAMRAAAARGASQAAAAAAAAAAGPSVDEVRRRVARDKQRSRRRRAMQGVRVHTTTVMRANSFETRLLAIRRMNTLAELKSTLNRDTTLVASVRTDSGAGDNHSDTEFGLSVQRAVPLGLGDGALRCLVDSEVVLSSTGSLGVASSVTAPVTQTAHVGLAWSKGVLSFSLSEALSRSYRWMLTLPSTGAVSLALFRRGRLFGSGGDKLNRLGPEDDDVLGGLNSSNFSSVTLAFNLMRAAVVGLNLMTNMRLGRAVLRLSAEFPGGCAYRYAKPVGDSAAVILGCELSAHGVVATAGIQWMGQRLLLPLQLTPPGPVLANLTTMALGSVIPMVLFGMLNALWIRPAEELAVTGGVGGTRHTQATVESERARAERECELMQPAVERIRSEEEMKPDGLCIIEARYGRLSRADGSAIGEHVVVTDPLQRLVLNSSVSLAAGTLATLPGFYDPCPGVPKLLFVRYLCGTQLLVAFFSDRDAVVLPATGDGQ